MAKTSPPLRILFFAARDLQRNYFSSLSHHLYCPSKVVWYKNIFLPGLHGIKFLRHANIAYIVDLKLREKQNATATESGSRQNNNLYWSIYGFIRRLGANFLFLKYFRYLQKNPSEIVAVWNGNKLRQAIVVQAAKFFENGLLPNTTTLDFQGVNAFNSLPRHREFYDELQFETDIKLPSQLVVRAQEGVKTNHSVSADLPEHFIFVPFQVNTDSQITIHSPWIRNMAHLFEVIVAAQKRLLENETNSEITFVFKEHPSSGQDYQQLHQRIKNEKYLMFANEINTQELIEKSAAVITINSTVGFEALLLGKKVIVLGDAFYGFEGLTKHAEIENDLISVLSGISKWQPDEKLRGNFLRYIQTEYAVPESWTKPGEEHWKNLNSKFDCIEKSINRALYMVSTPLNLFMACVVALDNKTKNDNHARYELCFIDQPGVSARVYVDAVKSWKDSPFDAVHVFPSRTRSPVKKLCNRRHAFRLLRTIVNDLQPDTIAVGSDRRIEFQFAMNYAQCAGCQPRGLYLDDGTFTYVGRKSKGFQESWLDNGLKKMIYGSWWQQPPTVGASEWIDDVYVAFPGLVHEALKQKVLHEVNANWFESPQFQDLSQSLLNSFDVDAELLRNIDVLITLPHASLLKDGAEYTETMQQLVKVLSLRGKRVGIKYHPREIEPDPLGLAGQSGVVLLPAVLAFEVLLPGLGNTVIVGDVSTTLLSSKWLRPALRTIAISRGSYQEQFLDLFQSLGIEVVNDASVLVRKLQD
jgi:hypothetical protein